jgi:regulator-associated protein of mTOR
MEVHPQSECTTFISHRSARYIPILLFDLLTWAGSSSCYVWDCQHSGRFIRAAITEAEEIDSQLQAAATQDPSVGRLHPALYARRQIHFASCGANEVPPHAAGMPDDLFTACLTTPLRISLLHHNLQTFPLSTRDSGKVIQRSPSYMAALYDNMSHSLRERLWSELQAIVVTIAWQSLDGRDYQMLFGQSDSVVSSLAAGFLLSQRVLAAYRIHPESIPAIPSSTSHALWTHWDLILDNLFEQLPPYFDDTVRDHDWENDLQLVSFMADQLESVQTLDQAPVANSHGSSSSTGLARLPIICKAAQTTEFGQRATSALNICLRDLDTRGLTHAVQGGALDTAAYLLALEDFTLASQMISIWASLVRHEACVRSLALEGRTAERLTSVPCVKFFLDSLEDHLIIGGQESIRTVIQTAAILSTIANFVAGRAAPRFVARTLRLSSTMLNSGNSLVQQWGSLLVAGVMGSISRTKGDNQVIIDEVRAQLLGLVSSEIVETRAAAVHALIRWIPAMPVTNIIDLESALQLVGRLVPHAKADGAAVVRKELVRLFSRVLHAGGAWTTLILWIYFVERAMRSMPAEKVACQSAVKAIASVAQISPDSQQLLYCLTDIIKAYDVLRLDPNEGVAKLVQGDLRRITGKLESYAGLEQWDGILNAAFPSSIEHRHWTLEQVQAIKNAGGRFLEEWWRRDVLPCVEEGSELNHELFEISKLSLQVYLGVSQPLYPKMTKHPRPKKISRTYCFQSKQDVSLELLARRRGCYDIEYWRTPW